jgi:hypothetical protein
MRQAERCLRLSIRNLLQFQSRGEVNILILVFQVGRRHRRRGCLARAADLWIRHRSGRCLAVRDVAGYVVGPSSIRWAVVVAWVRSDDSAKRRRAALPTAGPWNLFEGAAVPQSSERLWKTRMRRFAYQYDRWGS